MSPIDPTTIEDGTIVVCPAFALRNGRDEIYYKEGEEVCPVRLVQRRDGRRELAYFRHGGAWLPPVLPTDKIKIL